MNITIPIGVICGLIGYILITSGTFIWWAATTTSEIKNLIGLVKRLIDDNGLYARKEDIARELGVIEKNQETMWGKFDKLKEKVDINSLK